MLKQSHRAKEIKGHVVVLKLTASLVQKLDAMAAAEGISRSAIIRRALMERYQDLSIPSTRSFPCA